ncbi:hypothetical protein [Sinorhizobium sp. FG01]|uniref:hypothetical protein n=1 Tax=Sinorhizobium sp. FG01 TaxID=1538168 RepID=UPI001AEF7D9C|nr:hypothetical protein [Sinorhizobium sp. FG01]
MRGHALIFVVRQRGTDVDEVGLEQSRSLSGFMSKALPCIMNGVRSREEDLIDSGILHFGKQRPEPVDAVIDMASKSRDLVESDPWMR